MRSKQRKTNNQTKTVRWALRLIQMRSTPNPPIATSFLPSTSVFQKFDSTQTKPKFRSHCALTGRSWRALTCPTSHHSHQNTKQKHPYQNTNSEASNSSEYQIQKYPTGLRPALIKGHCKSPSTLCILNSYHHSTHVVVDWFFLCRQYVTRRDENTVDTGQEATKL